MALLVTTVFLAITLTSCTHSNSLNSKLSYKPSSSTDYVEDEGKGLDDHNDNYNNYTLEPLEPETEQQRWIPTEWHNDFCFEWQYRNQRECGFRRKFDFGALNVDPETHNTPEWPFDNSGYFFSNWHFGWEATALGLSSTDPMTDCFLGGSDRIIGSFTIQNNRIIMVETGRLDFVREIVTTQSERLGIQILTYGHDIKLISGVGIISQAPEWQEDDFHFTLAFISWLEGFESQYIMYHELPYSSLWQLLMGD